MFVIRVQDRTSETLMRAIRQHIRPGTHIVSDCWRAYFALDQSEYLHSSVNHISNFIDPNDSSVNTQRVERMWRTLKQIIPKTSSMETRWSYLAKFIFKQRVSWYYICVGDMMKLPFDLIKGITFS
jgi:hypothetical protein